MRKTKLMKWIVEPGLDVFGAMTVAQFKGYQMKWKRIVDVSKYYDVSSYSADWNLVVFTVGNDGNVWCFDNIVNWTIDMTDEYSFTEDILMGLTDAELAYYWHDYI